MINTDYPTRDRECTGNIVQVGPVTIAASGFVLDAAGRIVQGGLLAVIIVS